MWMHGLLPEKPGAQRIFDAAELVKDHSYGKVLHKHFKPRVVCRPCNNEWMSRLEIATKPIPVPLDTSPDRSAAKGLSRNP